MWDQLRKMIPGGQAKEHEFGAMRVEVISHDDLYFWLVEFKSGSVIEGYAKTFNQAMMDIICECGDMKVD